VEGGEKLNVLRQLKSFGGSFDEVEEEENLTV
jgi:hypothetical protein